MNYKYKWGFGIICFLIFVLAVAYYISSPYINNIIPSTKVAILSNELTAEAQTKLVIETVIKEKYTSLPASCLSATLVDGTDADPEISQHDNVSLYRITELHNKMCGGDPQTSPFVADVLINTKTGTAQIKQSQTNSEIASLALESKLLDTAWIRLDPSGKETDMEIDFSETKDNDPTHKSYDYQEYLHQRPGATGYWKVNNDTLEIYTHPFEMAPDIFNDVKLKGNILEVTENIDGTKLKFKRVP